MGIRLLPAAVPLFHVAKLASLLLLFLLALLLPPFLRVPYFYLLFNVIVLGLGVQAGLLRGATTSSFPRADDEVQHKSSSEAVAPSSAAGSPFKRTESVQSNDRKVVADHREISALGTDNDDPKKKKMITILLKKCPSRASIFFLCALDRDQVSEEEQVYEEEQDACKEVDNDVMMSRQELFARTERFLGDFRRHLSMRE